MHFFHDVAPSDKLAFDVYLRDGWPVSILLDRCAQAFICEHVDILEVSDTILLKKHNYKSAEATLWHPLCTLHENANIILTDPLRDMFCDFTSICIFHFAFWHEVIITIIRNTKLA